ncbi:AAEL007975-PA [Aedes aegypti]|uniref:AAEL007975-PA n=1 Tax=Aedes aegypti TaxID=7159 RepID=Q170A1_AEDAE|nr:AAEL007975-PA [Aedes aegypti]
MSFDNLPLEIVQLIFDYLSFQDVLSASLVCQRWYNATEKAINSKGWLAIHFDRHNDLTELAWSRRKHDSVLLTTIHSWDQLKPTMDVCSEKITLRRLSINRSWIDYVCQFFQLYADWVDRLEEIHISLDHRFLRNDTCSGRSYVIQLPTAKRLHWSEIHIRRGNRTITIHGPRLRNVSISDSFASKLNLILSNCDALESLECTLYRKNFTELYKASYENMTTLILRIYYTVQDVKFLDYLPKLKWLTLLIEFEKDLLETLFAETTNAICRCTHLEGLQFIPMGDIAPASVDLVRLSESLPRLQQLELSNMYLSSTRMASIFQRLTILKLVNVNLKHENDILEISYPSLHTLSLDVLLLPRLSLHTSPKKVELFINVDSLSIADTVELYLNPFLKQFYPSIQDMTLFKPDCCDTVVDSSCPQNGLERVTQLHLINMAISMKSLILIGNSKNLRHLTLSKCLIGVRGTDEWMLLEHLDAFELRQVQLDDRKQMRFPLARTSQEKLTGQLKCGSIVFNTDWDEDGLAAGSNVPRRNKMINPL